MDSLPPNFSLCQNSTSRGRYKEYKQVSPNTSEGCTNQCQGVIVHHSVLDFAASIEYMTDSISGVSYHCIIGPDGTRCTLVDDTGVAHHAGISCFQNRAMCNFFMLGLAFSGDTYRFPLSLAQVESFREWILPRRNAYGWHAGCVTDHRQVAPGRKNDLNPLEWQRLSGLVRSWFATV